MRQRKAGWSANVKVTLRVNAAMKIGNKKKGERGSAKTLKKLS